MVASVSSLSALHRWEITDIERRYRRKLDAVKESEQQQDIHVRRLEFKARGLLHDHGALRGQLLELREHNQTLLDQRQALSTDNAKLKQALTEASRAMAVAVERERTVTLDHERERHLSRMDVEQARRLQAQAEEDRREMLDRQHGLLERLGAKEAAVAELDREVRKATRVIELLRTELQKEMDARARAEGILQAAQKREATRKPQGPDPKVVELQQQLDSLAVALRDELRSTTVHTDESIRNILTTLEEVTATQALEARARATASAIDIEEQVLVRELRARIRTLEDGERRATLMIESLRSASIHPGPTSSSTAISTPSRVTHDGTPPTSGQGVRLEVHVSEPVTNLEEENEELRRKIAAMSPQTRQLSKDTLVMELNARIVSLETLVTSLQAQNDERQKTSTSPETLQNVSPKDGKAFGETGLPQTSETQNELNEDLREMVANLEKANKRIPQLEATIAALQQVITDSSTTGPTALPSNEGDAILKTELTTLQKRYVDSQDQLTSALEEVGRLKQATSARPLPTSREVDELRAQTKRLQTSQRELQSENDSAQNKILELQSTLRVISEVKNESERMVSELSEEIRALRDKLRSASSATGSLRAAVDIAESQAASTASCLAEESAKLKLALQKIVILESKIEAETTRADDAVFKSKSLKKELGVRRNQTSTSCSWVADKLEASHNERMLEIMFDSWRKLTSERHKPTKAAFDGLLKENATLLRDLGSLRSIVGKDRKAAITWRTLFSWMRKYYKNADRRKLQKVPERNVTIAREQVEGPPPMPTNTPTPSRTPMSRRASTGMTGVKSLQRQKSTPIRSASSARKTATSFSSRPPLVREDKPKPKDDPIFPMVPEDGHDVPLWTSFDDILTKVGDWEVGHLKDKLHKEFLALKHVLDRFHDRATSTELSSTITAMPVQENMSNSPYERSGRRYSIHGRRPESIVPDRLERLRHTSEVLEESAKSVQSILSASRRLRAMHFLPSFLEDEQDRTERKLKKLDELLISSSPSKKS